MIKELKNRIRAYLCKKKKPREIVIIFPFNTESKELMIVEEYIQHYRRPYWKYVSGGVDKPNKDLLAHAREELQEELGLDADSIYHIHSMEKIFGNRGTHFFVAENPMLMDHPPENPDTDVITQSKWVSEQSFQQMIDAKELLWDEASFCALQVFKKYQK